MAFILQPKPSLPKVVAVGVVVAVVVVFDI